MAHWIRIHLLMQGTQGTLSERPESWSGKITYAMQQLSLGTTTTEPELYRLWAARTKPECWNYWRLHATILLSTTREPCATRSPCSPQLEKSPSSNEDPVQPKINKIIKYIYIKPCRAAPVYERNGQFQICTIHIGEERHHSTPTAQKPGGNFSYCSPVLSGSEQDHILLLGLQQSDESQALLLHYELSNWRIPVFIGFQEYR